MSISDALTRVSELQSLLTDATPARKDVSTPTGASFGAALSSSSGSSNNGLLAALLQRSLSGSSGLLGGADGSSTSSPLGLSLPSTGGLDVLSLLSGQSAPVTSTSMYGQPAVSAGGGQGVLAAAQSQIGVSEQPPGSNDGPGLDVFGGAVAGAVPGAPWCAYFASWASAQAGEPLGPTGQGFGSVADITSWASSTGRLLPSSATPASGDLILFGDRHVGVVESVNADGSLTTVEGNYRNAVSRVQRSPAEATGYVRM